MKKLFSLILALCMVLCGVSALAESGEAAAFTGGTVEVSLNLSETGAAMLGSMSGMATSADSGSTDMFSQIATIINGLALKGAVSVADAKMEMDVLLNGEAVATVAGQATDEGLTFVSDLFPNTAVVVPAQAVQEALQAYIGSNSETEGIDTSALASLDIEALVEPIITGVQEKFGETVADTFEFEGVTYTARTPINITTKELSLLSLNFAKSLFESEAVASVTAQIPGFSMDSINEAIESVNNTPDEELPEAVLNWYSNENGDALFVGTVMKDGIGMEMEMGFLASQNFLYRMNLNAGEEAGTITYSADVDMNTGVMAVQFAQIQSGVNMFSMSLTGASAGNGYKLAAVLGMYGMDILTLNIAYSPEAVILATMETEGKNVITLDDLSNTDSSVLEGLISDMQTNGLQAVLTKAMQVMPELGSLIATLSGAGAEATAE